MSSYRQSFSKKITSLPGIIFLTLLAYYFINVTGFQYVIGWDVLGYYLYLPATFIYDDLALQKVELYQHLIDTYNLSDTFYQVVHLKNGHVIGKYSFGLAIFYAPFFFIGDLIASISDSYPQDGFSLPYQAAMHFGGFLYTVLGVVMISKILKKFYSNIVTIITATCFLFGTNYLANVLFSPAMPHNILFFAYALIINLSIKWRDSNKVQYLIYLGIVLGALILARPSELVAVLIPMLWGVTGMESLKLRIKSFKAQKTQLLLFFMILLSFGIPQFAYWEILAGKWLVTDYGNPAEGMDFLYPHIFDVLFSFRKGWFIYTPIMALATFGFIFLKKHKPQFFFPLIIFFFVNVYIISSWSCWWYAGSFSCRAIVQSSFVMLFPLAEIIKYFSKSRFKIPFYFLLVSLITLNLFQTWQYSAGLINPDRMTMKAYFKSFGKTRVPVGFEESLLVNRGTTHGHTQLPHRDKIKLAKTFSFSFETPDEVNKLHKQAALSGGFGDYIGGKKEFTKALRIPYHELTDKKYAWLRIRFKIKPSSDPGIDQFYFVYLFEYKGKGYDWRHLNLKDSNLDIGEWNTVETIYLTPEVRTKNDQFTFYMWNTSTQFVAIDDLEIDVFEKNIN